MRLKGWLPYTGPDPTLQGIVRLVVLGHWYVLSVTWVRIPYDAFDSVGWRVSVGGPSGRQGLFYKEQFNET